MLYVIPVLKQQFIESYKWDKSKKISIKNGSYYFCNDMINIKIFHSNLLTIDKSHIKKLMFTISVTLRLKNLVIVKIFTT